MLLVYLSRHFYFLSYCHITLWVYYLNIVEFRKTVCFGDLITINVLLLHDVFLLLWKSFRFKLFWGL